MKGFKLYLVANDGSNILISDYEVGRAKNQMLTINEQLTEQEHDRFDLAFEVVEKPSNFLPSGFSFGGNFKVGREIRMSRDNDTIETKRIDFIITSVTPNFFSDSLVFSITCQDYASYVWSKNNSGLEFDSFTDEEMLRFDLDTNAYNIGNYLISRGHLGPPLVDGVTVITKQRPQTITLDNIGDSLWTDNYTVEDTSLVRYSNLPAIDVLFNEYRDISAYVTHVSSRITSYSDPGSIIPWNPVEVDRIKIFVSRYSDYNKYNLNIEFSNSAGDSTVQVTFYSGTTISGIPVLYYDSGGNYVGEGTHTIYPARWGSYVSFKVRTSDLPVGAYARFKYKMLNKPDLELPIKLNYDLELFNTIYSNNGRITYTRVNSADPDSGIAISTLSADLVHTLNEVDFSGDLNSWKLIFNNNINLLLTKVNISVSSSNTYNALLELANTIGAIVKINYIAKEISLISKEDTDYFDTTYRLSPNYNISALSVAFNSDNFSPLMYVAGGQDEYGAYVTIAPSIPASAILFLMRDASIITESNVSSFYKNLYTGSVTWRESAIAAGEEEATLKFIEVADKIPYLDNFIYNLSYFESNDLMTSVQNSFVFNAIYNDLRKINYEFQNAIKNKHLFSSEIYMIEQKILSLCELIGGGGEESTPLNIVIEDINKLFESISSSPEYSLHTLSSYLKTDSPNAPVVANFMTVVATADKNGVDFIQASDGTTTYDLDTNGNWINAGETLRIVTNFDSFDEYPNDATVLWDDIFPIEETYSYYETNYYWNNTGFVPIPGHEYDIEVDNITTLNKLHPADINQNTYALVGTTQISTPPETLTVKSIADPYI